jgi:hypothetical protein
MEAAEIFILLQMKVVTPMFIDGEIMLILDLIVP